MRSVGFGPLRETRSSVPASGLRGVSRTFTHSDDVLQPPVASASSKQTASVAARWCRSMASGGDAQRLGHDDFVRG